MAKDEIFGTLLRPNARWTCKGCKRPNVSKLLVPVRAFEDVFCKGCHRSTRLGFNLADLPPLWGGTKGLAPEVKSPEVPVLSLIHI